MLYNSKLHSKAQGLKSLLGYAEKFLGGLTYDTGELLVLNYHGTPKKFIASFEKQLLFLKQHFNIIRPDQLPAYYSPAWESEKCSLLITFDDGLKNNLYATEILDRHNIKAFFFLVPCFIDADDQKSYYLENIRPVINYNIDNEPEDFTALSWQDAAGLVQKGHATGSHTLSHTLFAAATSKENSQKEILNSKKSIEERLGIIINSFCSINNTLESVGSYEKKLIGENYDFHFTTLPGLNAKEKDPLFIKRRNVECYWPDGAFYYALGKRDLSRWREKMEAFKKL